MKVTLFTGNNPRHLGLVSLLADAVQEVHVVQECKTVFPGAVADHYRASRAMERYFAEVISVECKIFGTLSFSPVNARTMSIKSGDLSMMSRASLNDALDADAFIVFGASFIKGWLADFLFEKRAVNVHMGVSPYFRGNSCNFWALWDGRPDLVGATIHLLSPTLDGGSILFHALPSGGRMSGFELGMRAVLAAQKGLVAQIRSGALFEMKAHPQDLSKEIRYSRRREFDDDIAEAYLANPPMPERIEAALARREMNEFIQPFVW